MFCLQESNLGQVTKDLNDGLEQQKNLEEQLKHAKEEMIMMRERLSNLEEENKKINHTADVFVDDIVNMFENLLQGYKRKKD